MKSWIKDDIRGPWVIRRRTIYNRRSHHTVMRLWRPVYRACMMNSVVTGRASTNYGLLSSRYQIIPHKDLSPIDGFVHLVRVGDMMQIDFGKNTKRSRNVQQYNSGF